MGVEPKVYDDNDDDESALVLICKNCFYSYLSTFI